MALKEEELAAWATAEGISTPFSFDQLPDTTPNRVHMIRLSGGLGLESESAFDKPTFQLQTRGVNGKDARDLALTFDELWLDQEHPFYIGDSLVIGTGRSGGPPTFIAMDDDRRVIRSATYWCRISRKDAI